MAVQGVNVGSSNQYRVRAAYTSGTTSTWQKTASYSMQVIQENDSRITYSGSWRTDASSDALGGHLRSTGTQGAFAKFTFTGRAFAWIAPRSAGSNASVYVDGKLLKTVILAGTNEPRRVDFSVAWKSAGQHTVKIVKKYVTNRLPIDAFLVLA